MNNLDFKWFFDISISIAELGQVIYNFMLSEISILGINVSFFELLAGAGVVVLITASLVKALVPVA